VARPTDLTEALSIEVARHLIDGCSIADACALTGIGESTYHQWVARGAAGESPFAEFAELTRAARAEGRQHHVRAIRSATADDWKAAAWFLERSDPANWGRQDRPPEPPAATDDDFEIDLGMTDPA
jgi:hypothetical protein